MNFDDPEAARDWADAWVVAHRPNLVVAGIDEFERGHRDWFLTEYGRGVEQFYVEFDALARAVDALNFVDRSDWPPNRSIQYVIAAKNLKAFHSAMKLLTAGFYVDAMSLVRGIYDAFLRIVHVALYPADPWGAVADKPPSPTPHFNATGIVRDQLRLDWLSNYSIMSVFAHANTFEVMTAMTRMADRVEPAERFGLVFERDDRLVETVLPLLSMLMLLYLRLVIETMGGGAKIRDSELVTTCEDAIGLLTFVMRTNDKPKWHSMADDVDYIFEVLRVADTNGNWTGIRDLRPTVERRT